MPKLPIQHGDSGAIAREKINESWNALLQNVEEMRPHIKDGYWRIGEVNTQVRAMGRSIRLRINEGNIEYQAEDGEHWEHLIALELLKGRALRFEDLTPDQKRELKGEQGDQGVSITAITDKREGNSTKLTIHKSDRSFQVFQIRDGKNPEFQFSETHLQYRLEGEEERKNLIEKSAIKGGAIQSIERTSGNGGAGSVDVYTIRLSDGSSQELSVYNGRDGTGAGDMLKSENLAGLSDVAQARENLGAEATSNKKTSIEDNKTSNSFFPTVKAVYDWVVRKLTSKADLVKGKVPAEQLPEMQAIDESNLVHKSGDEEIGGVKTFSNDMKIKGSNGDYWRGAGLVFQKQGGVISATNPQRKIGGRGRVDGEDALWFEFYDGANYKTALQVKKDGLVVGGQNWTGEWQTYTPTITTGSGNLGEYRIRNGRYKVVGKTVFCAIYLDFKRGEATGGIDVSLPTNSKNHTETPVPIIVGGHGMLYKDTKAKGAIKTGGKLRILKGIVSGVSIQELSPHSESHFVICGEFMYEMP